MTIRNPTHASVLAAAAVILAGLTACEAENRFGIVSTQFDGNFEALSIVIDDGNTALDLVADGASLDVGLDGDDGTFTSTFDDGVNTPFQLAGTFDRIGNEIVFSDDPLTIDAAVNPRAFLTDQLDGNLVLTDGDAAFDIDDDGDDDPVEVVITLAEV